MVSAALLSALAGFLAALVPIGVPLVVYMRRLDQRTRRSLRLLTGDDEVHGDGVLPRLRDVERRSAENRVALEDADVVDVPDLDAEHRLASSGDTQ